MSKLLIEIPEDVADALRIPPAERDRELRVELALALYRREVLSGGMACKLANVTRVEFDSLLGRRRVRRHYDENDLQQDLEYGLNE